ncbi:hypothetical protein [Flavobacterium covae]|uniref:hypothetical protein n=1 Tax=Flavobacterium covae TaxID=2906076 RepID=UPI0033931D06
MEIDLVSVKNELLKIKGEILLVKPITYDILKPHVKDKVDKELNRLMTVKYEPIYEVIFTDETINKIANSENKKLSTEIYNLMIIDKYKTKLYNKFSKTHPIIIASKILAYCTLSFLIIGMISGLIAGVIIKELGIMYGLFLGIVCGFIVGFGLSLILEKLYALKIKLNK